MPILEGARELTEEGFVPGGTSRNLASVTPITSFGNADATTQTLLADAQTSGGLLMAIDAPLAGALLQALDDEGVRGHVIGRFTARSFSDGPADEFG